MILLWLDSLPEPWLTVVDEKRITFMVNSGIIHWWVSGVGPAISKKSNTQVNTAPFLFRSIRRWVRQTLISLRLTLIIEFSQHACPIAHCKSFEGVFLTPHYTKLNFQHKKTIHIFSFAPTINYHYTPNSKYSKLEPC